MNETDKDPLCLGADHLEIAEETCARCGLEVDQYGNTEAQSDFCCFPDCGCDGARNCNAKGEASSGAMALNREQGQADE